jgi:hypothetical protein
MHGKIKNSLFNKVLDIILCVYNPDKIELRRVQALQGEKSFTIVLPKEFAVGLGIGKGDFLKCIVEGQKLVIQKVDP